MRILVTPEVYRPDDLTANGTVNDAATWVGEWLKRDPRLHVYWLLPPRDDAGYDASLVHADRDRVTLIEAPGFMRGADRGGMFTEGGYSRDQLRALRREIYDAGGYVDVAVDGRRAGRTTLYKWLLDGVDQWAADVSPVDVVVDVHDLQVPFKHRYCDYRNEFQWRMEAAAAVFADGIWFKAGADADQLRARAPDFLDDDAVESALSDAVETGSPIDLSGFEESYADRPEWLHVAGSLWDKKCADRVLAVAEALFEAYGVRTLLTSMAEIPDDYRRLDFVDAYPEADRDTYERVLERGDLAICASEYETMARTPFEQAASGQVLLLRDEPWIDDCVPDDHPLTADVDALADLAARAVEHWDDAIAANRRLVDHVREVRSPERAGRVTYRDLRRRVEIKTERYAVDSADAPVTAALAEFDGPVSLANLDAATADHAPDGRPVTDHDDYARTDLIYALRSLGYRDTGAPGAPAFEFVGGADADITAEGDSPAVPDAQ